MQKPYKEKKRKVKKNIAVRENCWLVEKLGRAPIAGGSPLWLL